MFCMLTTITTKCRTHMASKEYLTWSSWAETVAWWRCTQAIARAAWMASLLTSIARLPRLNLPRKGTEHPNDAAMKTIVCVLPLLLLSACTRGCSAGFLSPDQLKAEEEQFYSGKSTPQNVASDPELRSLIPADANPYGWKFPNQADF